MIKIKFINFIGKRHVYDIVMKKNHNFILDNKVISHNSETRGIIEGQSNITILCKMTGEGDKEASCAQLKRDGLMTSQQVADLSILNKGEAMYVESGKRVVKRYFLMPRTMIWKTGRGDFYSDVWKNYVNKWVNIENASEEIEKVFNDERNEIIEKEALEKEIEEDKKNKKKSKRRKTDSEKIESMYFNQDNNINDQEYDLEESIEENAEEIISKDKTQDDLVEKQEKDVIELNKESIEINQEIEQEEQQEPTEELENPVESEEIIEEVKIRDTQKEAKRLGRPAKNINKDKNIIKYNEEEVKIANEDLNSIVDLI